MRSFLIALASIAAASISAAQDARWTLVQSVGEVTVEDPGLSKIAVKPNASLREGATLTTGANGRAILTDGRSSITVNANSRIELPAAGGENVTSVRQDFGKALFKVQKKPTAHFEVQTPYLAAVVKGTTFEVTVDAMGASVDVEEGLVEVNSVMSGERASVPGGQRIRVLRSGRFEGDRPVDSGGGRQTIAALNVIAVEIAPEADVRAGQEREFASLQPKFDAPSARERRDFDSDRDRDEGASPQPPPEAGGGSTDGIGGRPPEPVASLPDPVAPPAPAEAVDAGGGSSAAPVRSTSVRDYDRERWAAFLERLKQAYLDWKAREGSDPSRYSWDRDD